jgi:hypothetical protein
LVLFGRYCLVLRGLLEAAEGQQEPRPSLELWLQPSAAAEAEAAFVTYAKLGLNYARISGLVAPVAYFLELPAVADELKARGYSEQYAWLMHLLQDLQSMLAPQPFASQPAAAPAQGLSVDAAATDFAPANIHSFAVRAQLSCVGMALNNFAIPNACNNPHCSSVLGPSEARLAVGRSCKCGGSLIAHYYCGRACQRQHRAQHKPVCKALAAAAAGSIPTCSCP